MPHIQANSIKIETEHHGHEGQPAILLIRGLGSQLIHWPDRLISGLVEAGHRVITYDNRDVGLSEKFSHYGMPDFNDPNFRPPYLLDDMARDAIAVLDHYNIKKAHIFGISMGGMISQILAATHPQRLKSATIVMSSSGPKDTPPISEEAQRALSNGPTDPFNKSQVLNHGLTVARFCGSPNFPFKDEDYFRLANAAFDRCHAPDGIARQLAAIYSSPDRSELLNQINIPTLVIHGTHDALLPLEHGRDIAKKIKGSKLIEIEGMGHDLAGELPDIMIKEFLNFHQSLAA